MNPQLTQHRRVLQQRLHVYQKKLQLQIRLVPQVLLLIPHRSTPKRKKMRVLQVQIFQNLALNLRQLLTQIL